MATRPPLGDRRHLRHSAPLGISLALPLALAACAAQTPAEAMLAAWSTSPPRGGLLVVEPPDGALFPEDIAPPTFRWQDIRSGSDAWLVVIDLGSPPERMAFEARQPHWTPAPADWERIKARSVDEPARVSVAGARMADPGLLLSGAEIAIRTSPDEVGAPVFYRDVPLPFVEAVKDPSLIRWRFGSVASLEQPPAVLEGLPVCANCHSFSQDGGTLGMDVDFGNDKGSYALVDVEERMILDRDRLMTWSDFEKGGEPTFGLLSSVSPDGRHVASTVRDRSVFVVAEDLAFSQLFFPIQGILAIYSREDRTLLSLPGADDPAFVQSNPAWSPDGRSLLFSRAPAYRLEHLRNPDIALLAPDEAREFTQGGRRFRYDIYRIPFDGGRGGTAMPLEGASNNGRSNYFPRFSPDGRWIVFCQADSFMLLQPDADLYIVPAEGGTARRLEANLPGMNSWHAWSPNSRWLVFASKSGSPYTRLRLTHIDEHGDSSPPVLLDRFVAGDRAANIPEFVDAPADAIRSIRERFVDDVSYARTARANLVAGDPEGAIRAYRAALEVAPDNVAVHVNLGSLLMGQGDVAGAARHLSQAVALDPGNAQARVDLGAPLFAQGRLDEAEAQLREAIRLAPGDPLARRNLGHVLRAARRYAEATSAYEEALVLDPADADAGMSLAWLLATAPAADVRDGRRAVDLAGGIVGSDEPGSARSLDVLAAALAESGDFGRAAEAAGRASVLAARSGDRDLEDEIRRRLALYESGVPFRIDGGAGTGAGGQDGR